ncbi:MAG: hypothetical protein HQL20_06415 [Candidatus Omnitrophica bacterium]|nr:hypothetical protein [Candidatus Omnitrophota bacterium]
MNLSITVGSKIVVVMVVSLALVGVAFAQQASAPQAVSGKSSSAIEIYVAGRKFISLSDYEKQKAVTIVPVVSSASTITSEASFDPLIGKTLTISPEGTVITSSTTMEEGKTIEIKPRANGRVAGVAPSFKQIVEDFDSGAGGNGAEPKKIASAEQLDEELRARLRAHHRPVLLISDKQKVRVMGLE